MLLKSVFFVLTYKLCPLYSVPIKIIIVICCCQACMVEKALLLIYCCQLAFKKNIALLQDVNGWFNVIKTDLVGIYRHACS